MAAVVFALASFVAGCNGSRDAVEVSEGKNATQPQGTPLSIAAPESQPAPQPSNQPIDKPPLEPPQLTATPNPVPPDSNTTTITWDTGAKGVLGEVYVSTNGKPEVLVARGPRGEKQINWIPVGNCEFRLYRATGKDSGEAAKIVVTRAAKPAAAKPTASVEKK